MNLEEDQCGHRQGTAKTESGTEQEGKERSDCETVLVVDDDEEFAETVGIWLKPEKTVVLAHDGEQALEAYGPHVDAVLLDRRMPTMSGDEVVGRLRQEDGADAAVAVMTAMRPDENIVKADFDVYLQKPVKKDTIIETVETLLERVEYPEEVRQLYSLSSKLEAFEATHSEDQLATSEHYQRLSSEFEQLREQSSQVLAELEDPEIIQYR